jgi:hypothetical protein
LFYFQLFHVLQFMTGPLVFSAVQKIGRFGAKIAETG